MLVGRHLLFVLACAIRGKCIRMRFKFEVQPVLTVHVHRVASRATFVGAASATRATTPPAGGSSPSLSSLGDRRELRELAREADEACQHCSDTTREASQLERCLDAIRVALEASERETIATWAAAIDT